MKRQYSFATVMILGLGLLVGCASDTLVEDSGGSGSVDSGNGNEPGPSETPGPGGDAVADFSLTDVNPNSSRYLETVSPRDYLGQISVWYFGHAT